MRLSYTITQTYGRTRRSPILASENNSKHIIIPSTPAKNVAIEDSNVSLQKNLYLFLVLNILKNAAFTGSFERIAFASEHIGPLVLFIEGKLATTGEKLFENVNIEHNISIKHRLLTVLPDVRQLLSGFGDQKSGILDTAPFKT